MKPRPLALTQTEARAAHEGRLSCVVRIVKPQPIPFGKSSYGGTRQGWRWKPDTLNRSWNDDDADPYNKGVLASTALRWNCPLGHPGGELWVREPIKLIQISGSESWAGNVQDDAMSSKVRVQYLYDGQESEWIPYPARLEYRELGTRLGNCYREASRTTLRLESVAVKRVQDLTEEEAKGTGVESHMDDGVMYYGPFNNGHCDPLFAFKEAFNAQHGPGSFEANCWVWVATVEKVTPAPNF